MSAGKIHISRHVIFDELDFPFAKSSIVQPLCSISPSQCVIPLVVPSSPQSPTLSSPLSSSSELVVPNSDSSQSISTSMDKPVSATQPLLSHDIASPALVPQPLPSPIPSSRHPIITRAKNGIFKPKLFLSSTENIFPPPCEPNSFQAATRVPEWQQAMHLEFEALMKNKTWVLVPPPPNQNVIGCRWVYKLKLKPDGSIDRYRARLVAKGFHQTHGFDYFETFSPVVKPNNIHVVLSLALNKNRCIRQLDVHDAFLNGDLPEQVFMMQPQVLWILLNPIFL